MAFGDITLDEAKRSVELFAQEVMPALAMPDQVLKGRNHALWDL
jgi:hypothetical protein